MFSPFRLVVFSVLHGFCESVCLSVSRACFYVPVSYTHLTLPTNREV